MRNKKYLSRRQTCVIYYFSILHILKISAMPVRLAEAALANSVFIIYVQVDMAASARRINMDMFFLPIVNYPQFILKQNQEIG